MPLKEQTFDIIRRRGKRFYEFDTAGKAPKNLYPVDNRRSKVSKKANHNRWLMQMVNTGVRHREQPLRSLGGAERSYSLKQLSLGKAAALSHSLVRLLLVPSVPCLSLLVRTTGSIQLRLSVGLERERALTRPKQQRPPRSAAFSASSSSSSFSPSVVSLRTRCHSSMRTRLWPSLSAVIEREAAAEARRSRDEQRQRRARKEAAHNSTERQRRARACSQLCSRVIMCQTAALRTIDRRSPQRVLLLDSVSAAPIDSSIDDPALLCRVRCC